MGLGLLGRGDIIADSCNRGHEQFCYEIYYREDGDLCLVLFLPISLACACVAGDHRRPRGVTSGIRFVRSSARRDSVSGLLHLFEQSPLRRVPLRSRHPRPAVDFPSTAATPNRRLAVPAPSSPYSLAS